jgi:hypothetical protein
VTTSGFVWSVFGPSVTEKRYEGPQNGANRRCASLDDLRKGGANIAQISASFATVVADLTL